MTLRITGNLSAACLMKPTFSSAQKLSLGSRRAKSKVSLRKCISASIPISTDSRSISAPLLVYWPEGEFEPQTPALLRKQKLGRQTTRAPTNDRNGPCHDDPFS